MAHFGFSVESITEKAQTVIDHYSNVEVGARRTGELALPCSSFITDSSPSPPYSANHGTGRGTGPASVFLNRSFRDPRFLFVTRRMSTAGRRAREWNRGCHADKESVKPYPPRNKTKLREEPLASLMSPSSAHPKEGDVVYIRLHRKPEHKRGNQITRGQKRYRDRQGHRSG